MNDPLTILIAGYGYVGSALGARLQAKGHAVLALCREPSGIAAGIQALRADLTRPETLSALPARLDHVVFCASAGESSDDAYRRLYVEGLGNLLTAIGRTGSSPRVFFTSSTAVYAQNDGSWVNETSPTEPTQFSGVRTLEAERLLLGSGLPATVLRCSGIYGPGRQRIVDGLNKGTLKRPPDDRYTNRIHRDDVAGVIEHLISNAIQVERLLVSDDDPASYGHVLETLAERLGVPAPGVETSAGPLRFGGNKRCSNRRLRETGYQFSYPTFREGYETVIAQARLA